MTTSMAKRSDFAQKLLDDLRLRKERMTSSRTSFDTSINPTFADAYAYTKGSYTGSRERKQPDTIISSRGGGGTSHRSSSGTEIVPSLKSKKLEQLGELSMVLSFALKNGAQVTKVESSGNKSFFKFLQQIGKRRMGLAKTEKQTAVVTLHRPSTSQLPALSHLQVEKISEGVQKLNRVLQVYGNVPNLDRYSIEIGQELLKGAMDLEESLQILVSLQEASEYMTTPRRKTTLTLLEDDDDSDDNLPVKSKAQKQLARTSFSFGTTNRKYTNGKEKDEVAVASTPRYHRRSVSYGSDIKKAHASFSEEKSQNAPKSNPGKGRISNVIAKLMGLDDTRGTAGPKETIEGTNLNRNFKRSIRMEETTKVDTVDTASVSSTVKKKEIKDNSTPVNLAAPQSGYRDAEKVEIQRPKVELELHRRSKSEISLSQGNTQERKRAAEEMDRQSAKQKLQERTQREDELVLNKSLSPMHIASTPRKRLPPSNQVSVAKHNTSSSTRKHLTEQVNGTRTGGSLDVTHQGDLSRGRSLANNISTMKASTDENFNSRSTKDNKKAKDRPTQPVQNRPFDAETIMKARSTRLSKIDTPPKMNEVMTKKGGNAASFSMTVKHQGSIKDEKQTSQVKPITSREVDPVKTSRSEEVEVPIISFQKPFPSAAGTASVEKAIQSKAEQDSKFSNLLDAQCGKLSEPQTSAARDDSETKTCQLKNDQQDEEFKIGRSISSNEADGPCKKEIESCDSLFNQFPTSGMQKLGQLTEDENQLKQILLKNQLFVNTAEVLFKLNIPFGVLQASEPGCLDADSKLLLDCSYEVMKRKGKRKELSIHPFIKSTITNSTRVKTLDDLIKLLQKDLDSLKSYGRDGNLGDFLGDLLPEMLESDLYYKDADLNGMWDCGWNDMMLMFHEKDDIIRDVERKVLKGLIDEIARDLSISVSA